MKVTYDAGANCAMEVEVKSLEQAFQFMAYADDVFGIKKCGNCGSPHLTRKHRQPKGYDYYSVECDDCRHEMKFGKTKEGGKLYPKGWEPPYKDQPQKETSQQNDTDASSDNDDDVAF